MPRVDINNADISSDVPVGLGFADNTPKDESASFSETMGAMFRTENTIGTILARGTQFELPTAEEQSDYISGNWDWEAQAKKTEYAENQEALDYLSLTKNQRSFNNAVEGLRKYDADREIIANSGTGAALTAGIIAGTLDPVQFPLMAIPALKSASLLKMMASVGAGGLGGATLAEGVLHPLQPTRTIEESYANMGLSAAFGIGLGGLSYGIGRAIGLSVLPSKDLTPEIQNVLDEHLAAPMDAGAAATIDPQFNNPAVVKSLKERMRKGELTNEEAHAELRKHQMEWTGTKFPKTTRLLARISPHVRVATSPFLTARVLNESLTEGTLVRGKHTEGITTGPAVETIINGKRDLILAKSYDMVGEAWREHTQIKTGPFKTFRGNHKAKNTPDQMTLEEFSTEIGRAIDAGGKHDNPAIAKVANKIHNEILEPFEMDLVETGLIGEEELFVKHTGEKVKEVEGNDEGLPVREILGPHGSFEYIIDKPLKDGSYRSIPFDRVERVRVSKPPVGSVWFFPRMWNFDYLKSHQKKFTDIMLGEIEKEVRTRQRLDLDRIRGVTDANIREELGLKTELTGRRVTTKFAKNEISMKPQHRVFNEHGEDIGYFTLKEDGKNLIFDIKGDKDYMHLAMLEAASQNPKSRIVSTTKMSQKAEAAWQSLVKKNKAKKLKKGGYRITKPPKVSEADIRVMTKKRVEDIYEAEVQLELDEIKAGMGDFIGNIISTPTGFVPKDMAFKGSHLLERTLKVNTKAIQDFLIQDVRYVLHGYFDSMMPRKELAAKFDGDFSLEPKFKEIETEYQNLVEKLPAGKEQAKLTRQKEDAVKDLLGMRDILLRNFKRPDDPGNIFNTAGRRIREWNYVTKLGGMTAAAIPDVANIVMRNGFQRLAKQLSIALPHPKDFINMDQARQVGAALDYQLQGRAEAMLMIDENYGHVSRMDTNINKGVRQFGNITLMTYWNTFWKSVAANAFTDEVGAIVSKTGLTSETKKWLAGHQIPVDVMDRIKEQWAIYGTTDHGLRIPNTKNWTDLGAKEILEASILKEANTSIVTPGAGDLPLVSRHVVGKLWLQFATFPMSATTRLMLPMIQSFDAQKAAGGITMLLLGMTSYSIKEIAAGREPSTDISTLVREGIDRSGMFGMWTNINAILEKGSGGHLGLQAIMGGEAMTKYRARSVVNDLMGPSMGTTKDIIRVTNAIINGLADGEISSGDINAVRRLIPLQNLIFTRRLFDEVAKVLGEKVDE